MEQSARVIEDSIGPTGQRITTVEIDHWRAIHPEILRHRLFSFSVASSRAIPYEKQRKQVSEDPMFPIYFPKVHKGMQSAEVMEGRMESFCKDTWLEARDYALQMADRMSKDGVSKQLTNRLLENWISTRCVITATDFENFFLLRHPWHWHYSDGRKEGNYRVWEDEVNLSFGAEYNAQLLAIKMKRALDASEPKELEEGEWHLPFITDNDWDICHELYAGYDDKKETILDTVISMLLKVSAARNARTSYGASLNKTIEDDIKLADDLLKSYHMSPFEHQAQAVDVSSRLIAINEDFQYSNVQNNIPKGMELRLGSSPWEKDIPMSLWSGNFQNWVQYRKLLEL